MPNLLVTHSEVWRCFGVKAVAGDNDALGGLLQHYRPVLTAMAEKSLSPQLKSKSGASDLVQKTCEDAFLGITRVRARNGHQLWWWLSSLLSKNVCDLQRQFVHCQKRSVRQEVPLVDRMDNMDRCSQPVFHEVTSKETAERLQAAMNRIPMAHRQVLQWRFFEEKSCEEIALMVSRSTDSVRMMVNRALRKLELELPGNFISV